jgi:hypothetical protein
MAMVLAEGVDVLALAASYHRGLVPLKEAEPGGMMLADPKMPGKLSLGLGDDLSLISTKIAPTMSTEQADAWIKVMVIALSDLPGRVSREAAARALHRPMKFLNEVETVIREEATVIAWRHTTALSRLRKLHEEMARDAGPVPAAPEPVEPLTAQQIRALPQPLREIGLKIGAITEADIDAAYADLQDEARAA